MSSSWVISHMWRMIKESIVFFRLPGYDAAFRFSHITFFLVRIRFHRGLPHVPLLSLTRRVWSMRPSVFFRPSQYNDAFLFYLFIIFFFTHPFSSGFAAYRPNVSLSWVITRVGYDQSSPVYSSDFLGVMLPFVFSHNLMQLHVLSSRPITCPLVAS